MCGLEITKYNAFCEAFRLHHINTNTWMTATEEFGLLVAQPREAQLIAENVAKVNAQPGDVVLGIDANYSCSHWPTCYDSEGNWVKGGPAPSSTTTIMCGRMILHQEHVHHKDIMAAKPGATGRERKDDLGFRRALEAIGLTLEEIDRICSDGCTSAQKIVNAFKAAFPQHAGVILTKDNWHFEKSIQKAWERKMKVTCEAAAAETAKQDRKGMKAIAIGLLRVPEPTETTNHADELKKAQSGDDGMPDAD